MAGYGISYVEPMADTARELVANDFHCNSILDLQVRQLTVKYYILLTKNIFFVTELRKRNF